jgi:hypothetical protein
MQFHTCHSLPQSGQSGEDNHDRLQPGILCKIARFWLRSLYCGNKDVSNSDQQLPGYGAIMEAETRFLLSPFRFSELSQPI